MNNTINNSSIWFLRSLVIIVYMLANFSIYSQSDWEFASIREEINPVYAISNEVLFKDEATLMLSGASKEFVNGSWTTNMKVEAGNYYEFITHFVARDVDDLNRSVLATITWLSKEGKQVGFLEFPGFQAYHEDQEWSKIHQVYQVPTDAVTARIDLIYRWDPHGKVYFGGTSLKPTQPLSPRLVKVGAIHHRPRNTASAAENLREFETYIDQAGTMGADIICLPEGITVVGNGKSYLEVSEPVPGPTTSFLGELAQKHQMYIVAGILENDGPVLYNTAVLIDREGKLAGKYRKVSLPKEEIAGGITPGKEFPVFETDFGTIGMMICWDVFFPEPARMLSMKGAEIIFMPIWGGNLTLSKARAIENQIYLVSSTYDMKTGIFDKTGTMIVEGTEQNPVVIQEIDLNQRQMWEWLGEFRNRIRREMPNKNAISFNKE